MSSEAITTPPSTTTKLLDRVNQLATRETTVVGETVRQCLSIIAGNDDPDRKTVRMYDKLVDLDPMHREAAPERIESLSFAAGTIANG